MDLEKIWIVFLNQLNQDTTFITVTKQIYSGTPFLYIECPKTIDVSLLEKSIREASALAMKGKRLHSETIFVRKETNVYVYRHRFYVPQEKMFCCGNLCINCVRLKKK
ncbi:hypothetical protein ACOI1C_01975 [Bacillus sp. DJP31]|uniref:hypothetical protein n=1 Tax=Bacillus sp. DJP31 TaxID=3409789 RepID=UPI003BB5433F